MNSIETPNHFRTLEQEELTYDGGWSKDATIAVLCAVGAAASLAVGGLGMALANEINNPLLAGGVLLGAVGVAVGAGVFMASEGAEALCRLRIGW